MRQKEKTQRREEGPVKMQVEIKGGAATSRGCLEPPKSGSSEERPSLELPAGRPCQHPHFGLLSARTVSREFQLLEAPWFEVLRFGGGVSPQWWALCEPVLDLPQPPVPAFRLKLPCPMAHPLCSCDGTI